MAKWYEYIAFYLGFKNKQKQIERAQEPQGLTDEMALTGDQAIPPQKSYISRYELQMPSIIVVNIESISGHVLDVSVVNKQNLARMSADTGKPAESALSLITDDEEQLRGELPAGEWAVVIYNTNETESVSAYCNVEIGEEGTASGGLKTTTKSPVIAGILSFLVPGAGQLYNHQLLRAITAFIAVPMSYLIVLFIGATANFPAIILLGLAVHIGVIYDVYNI